MLIPVILITGGFGVGKTTLINNIIKQFPKKKLFILENEFGEISIDSDFILRSGENLLELTNGCICCSLNNELDGFLKDNVDTLQDFDALIIETTGIAEIPGIVSTFINNNDYYKLYSIVNVIDTNFLAEDSFDRQKAEQLIFSDHIIINRCDNNSFESNEKLKVFISNYNSTVKLIFTNYSETDYSEFFVENENDIKNIMTTQFSHSELSGLNQVSLSFPGYFSDAELDYCLNLINIKYGKNLIRAKGVFNNILDFRKYGFNVVRNSIEIKSLDNFGQIDNSLNKAVFIGYNLQENDIFEYLDDALIRC